MYRRFRVGGGVVVDEEEIGHDAVCEAQELTVPIEPPLRVLAAKQDHEERPGEEEAPEAVIAAFDFAFELTCHVLPETVASTMRIGRATIKPNNVVSRLGGRSGWSTE
jgi:hypothetical protein